MGDNNQYGLPDLRQLMAGRTYFQANPPQAATTEPVFFLQSRHNNLVPQILTHHHHYHHDAIMAADSEVMLPSNNTCNILSSAKTVITTDGNSGNYLSSCGGTGDGHGGGNYFSVGMESGWIGDDAGNNNNNNNRWPRQETLTLLEIRSRLDSRFKEANQKGPLWDEISRIMAEEHGYQRSGKKCREKFENLYKYYKKTREGKAGRQDGKHYRFFRQLDALYGETSHHHRLASAATGHLVNADPTFQYQTPINTTHQENHQESNNNKLSDQSLSFSNTSEFETSSSDNNDDGDLSAIASYMMNRSMEKQKEKIERKNWKEKVKDLVDIQMKQLLEKQEAWMETMLRTIEHREQERMFREGEWTKQEAARLDRIHESWAKEKAWIEARDVALMEVLNNSKGLDLSSSTIEQIAIATQCHYKNQHRNAKKIDVGHVHNASRWSEPEIFSLVQIRTAMESRIAESSSSECLKQGLWEEIARKMACLGYDRSVGDCKEKWENMNIYFSNATDQRDRIKKRKEGLGTSDYFQQLDPFNGHERAEVEGMNSSSSPTSSSYMGSGQIHENCFQVSVNGGREHWWNRYDLKLRKEKNQQP